MTKPAMNDQDFYTAVGASGFPERYYALCKRFPIRDIPPCQLSDGLVRHLLSELGRKTQHDARDNSYNCDGTSQRGTLHVGFIIQKQAVLEFWFWLEQADHRIGSNYAVIAYESARLAGKNLSQPSYPRPEFHSVDELRFLLAECFKLADQLTTVVKREGCSGPANS